MILRQINIFIDKPIKTGERYGFYFGLDDNLIDIDTHVLSDYFLKPYNSECCLCFENIDKNNGNSFMINCGHLFHKSCFNNCNDNYLNKVFVKTCIENCCNRGSDKGNHGSDKGNHGIPFLYTYCKCPLCKNFEMLSKSTIIYVAKIAS